MKNLIQKFFNKYKQNETLKEECRAKMENVIKQLSEDNLQEIEKGMKWIELYKKIKSNKSLFSFKMLTSVIILCICFLFIWIGWACHINKTYVKINVNTKSIKINLDKDWEMYETLRINDLYLENVTNLKFPVFGISIENNKNETINLDINGSAASIENLKIYKDTDIDVSIDDTTLTLRIKKGEISGTLYLQDAEIFLTSEIEAKYFDIKRDSNEPPETLYFQIQHNKNNEEEMNNQEDMIIPLQMEFTSMDNFQLYNLVINKLHFFEEYPPDSGQFSSTINSGKINLLDTDKEIELVKGDDLLLEKITCDRFTLKKQQDFMEIQYEGTVGNISSGPAHVKRPYMPTLIEYIYKNQKVGFLWAAFLFVWGILWSIKNYFVNRENK